MKSFTIEVNSEELEFLSRFTERAIVLYEFMKEDPLEVSKVKDLLAKLKKER